MKKLLRWLFEDRMDALEREVFDESVYQDCQARRNYVAEKFLNQLGYEIEYDSGIRKQPSETIHPSMIGYKLVKKTPHA